MKLLYATTNKAKFHDMERVLRPLHIELANLEEWRGQVPQIEESGASPLENAEIKARAYYKAFGVPVFSCDSGLYFDGLEDREQPGVHVRRVKGRELSDEEMIRHYATLAREHGGRLRGSYRNAICLILGEGKVYCSMDPSLWTEPFLLVSQPHEKRVEGFPLDCLSQEIESGQYYYDLGRKEVSTSALEQGFQRFFARVLAEEQL